MGRKSNKNKGKEVKNWDDIKITNETNGTNKIEKKIKIYIPPKYTLNELKKMTWYEIEEDITDEEFFGYYAYK